MVLLKRLNNPVEKEAPHIAVLKVELFFFYIAIIHEGLVKVWLGVRQPLRRKQKVKDRRDFPARCFHSEEPVWQNDSAHGNTGMCRDVEK